MYGHYICFTEDQLDEVSQFIPLTEFKKIKEAKEEEDDDREENIWKFKEELNCNSYFQKYPQLANIWYESEVYNPCYLNNVALAIKILKERLVIRNIYTSEDADIWINNPFNRSENKGKSFYTFGYYYNNLENLLNTIKFTDNPYKRGVLKIEYEGFKDPKTGKVYEGHIFLLFYKYIEKEDKLILEVVDTGKWSNTQKHMLNNTLDQIFYFRAYTNVVIKYMFEMTEQEIAMVSSGALQIMEDEAIQGGYCAGWATFYIFYHLFKNIPLEELYNLIFTMDDEVRALFIYLWWDEFFRGNIDILLNHDLDVDMSDPFILEGIPGVNLFLYTHGEENGEINEEEMF